MNQAPPPQLDRLKREWGSFANSVIPRDAPLIQRREMRRAFYAGAQTMLTLCAALGTEEYSEEEGCRVLEELTQELQAFLSRVGVDY